MRYLFFLCILLISNIVFAGSWVEGYCYLENQIDHSGTTVIFEAASPSAVTDSMVTTNEGRYQLDIAEGIYNIIFQHYGYFEQKLVSKNLFNSKKIENVELLEQPQGIHLSGEISGVLQDTVYIVDGHPFIVDTVTIQPGAIFYFNEGAHFILNAPIYAIGTKTDSIKFIPNRNVNSWEGIYTEGNNGIYEYCLITGCSVAGILVRHSSPRISHCTFKDNSGQALHFEHSEAIINNCTITNTSGPIWCASSEPLFQGPTFINCTISGNHNLGLGTHESNPTLVNCIISDNSGVGIEVGQSSNVTITFSDFYNNAGIINGSLPFFGELITVNSNGDSCDAYYNIFKDPLFVDPDNGDFHLQRYSPAIDAGDPASLFDPDSTINDIGAYYFHQGPHPEIAVSTININYGTTVVSYDSIAILTITNDGDLNLIIQDIQITGSGFQHDWNPADSIILPSSNLFINVTFSPTAYCDYNETLTIQNNDRPVSINLAGTGIPPEGDFPTSLILTGGGNDSTNWDYYINNSNPSTNDAYNKLAHGRYYGDTRLFYMNPENWQDLNGDGFNDGIVDADSLAPDIFYNSLMDLYDSDNDEFPNVIFVAGHGHFDAIDINGNSDDDILIDTLAVWLDEASLDQATPLVIIFEACFSGGYIEKLAAPNRVIVSSCRGDQFADYIDGESFSTHFWYEVWYGNDLWTSFDISSSWSFAHLNGQEPQIDADGNGIPNETTDWEIASDIYLGGRYMHGALLPEIVEVPSDVDVNNGQFIFSVKCNGQMDKVWFRIYPKNYTGSPAVSELPLQTMQYAGDQQYTATYQDQDFFEEGKEYIVRVEAVDDIYNYAVPKIVSLNLISTGINEKNNVINSYFLNPAYPNPFNPTTQMKYGLKETGKVTICIYNILGKKVKTLINMRETAGQHTISWDGTNESGQVVSTGIYFCSMKINSFNN